MAWSLVVSPLQLRCCLRKKPVRLESLNREDAVAIVLSQYGGGGGEVRNSPAINVDVKCET